jgi:hypothetical protein
MKSGCSPDIFFKAQRFVQFAFDNHSAVERRAPARLDLLSGTRQQAPAPGSQVGGSNHKRLDQFFASFFGAVIIGQSSIAERRRRQDRLLKTGRTREIHDRTIRPAITDRDGFGTCGLLTTTLLPSTSAFAQTNFRSSPAMAKPAAGNYSSPSRIVSP